MYVVRNSNNGATYIQSVTITFNSTRLEIDTRDVWGNGVFPAGTIDGMPYYRYRLSSRWFAEPLIQARGWTALDESVGTKGFTVEPYSSDNCKNPTNKEVARATTTNVNGNQVFDLMFKNEGWCKVTAHGTNGQTASYLVQCWDNEAYYTLDYVDGQGMTYKFDKDPDINDVWQQGGVLHNRVVTAVPGLEVKFGIPVHDYYLDTNVAWDDPNYSGIPNNDPDVWTQYDNSDNHFQPNTCVVGAYQEGEGDNASVHMVSYIYDDDGWWDRWPTNDHSWPYQGTFYTFKATCDGTLRFGGYKSQASGKVYLVNLDNVGERIEVIRTGSDVGFYDIMKGYYSLDGGQTYTDEREIKLKAGDRYALHGQADSEGNKWAPFGLEWFAFETNIKLTEHYGVAAYSGYDIANNGNTFNSKETFTVTEGESGLKAQVMETKGTVTGATVTINNDGTLKFSNISYSESAEGKMGGALKVRLFIPSDANSTTWQEGNAYMDFVMTIPYGNHVWDFRRTEYQGTPSARLKASDVATYSTSGLVTMMAGNGDDWSRVYKVHQRSGGAWNQLISPILSARGSVIGNNAFYMTNTNGLIFLTGAESFGAEETSNTHMTAAGYDHLHGLAEVDDNVEYYYDWKTTTGAEKVWIKGNFDDGASILFPGVKPGQYIRVYTYRHAENKGETFKAKNLIDLDNVPYTYTDNDKFKMHGFGNGTQYPAMVGDNMRGCAIFRVPLDYTPTNNPNDLPRLTLCDDGWAEVLRIEILDELVPDLILTTHSLALDAQDDKNPTDLDLPIEFDGTPSSIVLRYGTDGNIIPVKKGFRAISANTGCQNANTCEYVVETFGNVSVTPERIVWTSDRRVEYNCLMLTFNSGTGLVKLIQREKLNATSSLVTTSASGATGHVIDKNEYYIAVDELKGLSYPNTWDFTTYNLYQGNSTTKTDLGSTTAGEYGNWNADANDQEGNTFGQHDKAVMDFGYSTLTHTPATTDHNAKVTKQLFAQGGELASGYTKISETKGLGVRRPYASTDKVFKYMEAGEIKERTYKGYDLKDGGISLDGNVLSGVGEITIPNVAAGMYVFVKAKNDPTSTSSNINAATKYANHTNKFNLLSGVKVYKVETTGDVVLTFSGENDIERIGVTDQFKEIKNTAGKTTESRAIAIDYSQTNNFMGIGMNAYRAYQYVGNNNKETGTIQTEVVGPTAANQGLLLFCTPTEGGNVSCPFFVPAVNNAPITYSETDNKMVAHVDGGTAPASTTDDYYYVFSNIYYDSEGEHTSTYGFYKVIESGELNANMAYLHLNKTSDNVDYTNMYVFIDGDNSGETGIENVILEDGVEEILGDDPVFYNLNGVRMNGRPSQRGIYIVNGKKIYVK